MKNMNPKLVRLLHEGFSINTLENLSKEQINVLHSKIVNEQPKPVEKTVTSKVIELPTGAKTAIAGSTVTNQGGKTIITTTPTEGELEEKEEFDSMDVNKGEDDQDPIQKQGPDGMPTETRLQEKAVSKQQQKIMGLALSVKKGDTPKSKVSKSVEKMSKEMSKKDLEDFASTKHKGLPKKIEATESIKKGVKRNDQKDMIDGVIEILKKVKDINNRKSIAKDMVNKFKREGIQTDFNKFMEDCGVDDTKKPVKNIGINKSDEQKKSKKIEESILSIIQNHLPPHTTKGEVMRSLNKRK